jgi:hypothetical protein
MTVKDEESLLSDHWRPKNGVDTKPHRCEDNSWTERATTDEFETEITKCLICKKTLRMKTVPKKRPTIAP